jgi:hypothetical protein
LKTTAGGNKPNGRWMDEKDLAASLKFENGGTSQTLLP